jgi:glycosyltransferase involved in cell wall biosynthesis
MTRILVLSNSPVGETMSAPGIRALNIARTLAAEVTGARITLAIPNKTGGPKPEGFRVVTYSRRSLALHVLRHDVIVAQYVPAYVLPLVLRKRVVLDFFANFVAEWLEISAEHPDDPSRAAKLDSDRRYLNLQLSIADLVLAANKRQRDLWIGAMAAIGRLTPDLYDADPSLRSLVDVAGFGVRPEAAIARKPVIKGVIPGIEATDKVLLWNGGILHWYDPATLLEGMASLAETRPDIKLLFLGTKYPVSDPIEGETLTRMFSLSDRLGLTGRTVFFHEGWMPYDATADYLIEADAGVCTYFNNLETHFAQRVRLVDLIWAETPIICNEGDTVAEMVAEKGLGLTVSTGDIQALKDAMLKAVDDERWREECSSALREAKADLSWTACLAPLVQFLGESASRRPGRSTMHTLALSSSYGFTRFTRKLRKRSTGSLSLAKGEG